MDKLTPRPFANMPKLCMRPWSLQGAPAGRSRTQCKTCLMLCDTSRAPSELPEFPRPLCLALQSAPKDVRPLVRDAALAAAGCDGVGGKGSRACWRAVVAEGQRGAECGSWGCQGSRGGWAERTTTRGAYALRRRLHRQTSGRHLMRAVSREAQGAGGGSPVHLDCGVGVTNRWACACGPIRSARACKGASARAPRLRLRRWSCANW